MRCCVCVCLCGVKIFMDHVSVTHFLKLVSSQAIINEGQNRLLIINRSRLDVYYIYLINIIRSAADRFYSVSDRG